MADQKKQTRAKTTAIEIESVYLAGPMNRPRPNVRVFARIGAKKFEFVRLDADALVEVYDYPRAWGGVARFVGYATKEIGAHLVEMARDFVNARAFLNDRFGRTIEVAS